MKGIAHFASGVAVATFFPQVVYGASGSLSLAPLLGGFAALLPDTLDFRLGRYLDRLDVEIDPAKLTTDENQPDPQAMAEEVARAIDQAYDSGQEVKIQLHTLKLGADLWQQYRVAFDPAHRRIVVRIGPAVTTGKVPLAHSESGGGATVPARGWAPVCAPFLCTYDADVIIDIFSGPSLALERAGDVVEVAFLPWHRAWSHSLVMALFMGVLGVIVAPVLGLVMALGTLAHIVEDQMGYMGSNLFFPITRRRTAGLRWMRSGDAIPNFLMVWISLSIIFLNLDRFSNAPSIPVLPYVLVVILAPALLAFGQALWSGRREARAPAAALAAVEALDELEEEDL